MLNLTKQQTIAEHRKMWRWIADETKKRGRRVLKDEYFEAMNIPSENIPQAKCYCCEYDDGHCSKCPIEWDGDFGMCCNSDEQGLFEQWFRTTDPEKSEWLARKIEELPER